MAIVKNPNFQHKYKDFTFKGKRKGEEIILLLRRHWLVFVFKFIPFLIIVLAIAAFHIFQEFIFTVAGLEVSQELVFLLESLVLIMWWLSLFITWINFYLDVWIVTDQRIVNIEQISLFRRSVSELEHSKIQDVTSEIHGIIPTLFRYGYVYIQTAGEKSRFVFKQVPEPVRNRNIIMKLHKSAIKREKEKEGEILRGKA